MTDAESSEPRATSAANWLGVVGVALFTAAALAAAQTRHYAATFEWSRQSLAQSDYALLFWIVASSALWALTPGVWLAGLALWRGRTRLAWGLAAASTAGVCFWAVVDLRVDIVTGKHALDYLRFLSGEGLKEHIASLESRIESEAMNFLETVDSRMSELTDDAEAVAVAPGSPTRSSR